MSEQGQDRSEALLQFEVGASEDQLRLDKFLVARFPERSRSYVQQLIASGAVASEDEILHKKNHKVQCGDSIQVCVPPQTSELELQPSPLPLEVLYEDAAIVVIDKPAQLTVHPGSGTGEDTLAHRFLHHCGAACTDLPGHPLRPGIVHRLDKDTTGVMVLAKTQRAYLKLVEAFAEREVEKDYRALVVGVPERAAGRIEVPIGRHPTVRVKMAVLDRGRAALTDWKMLEQYGSAASQLQCRIHTGRTHQIRVHLSHIGHPLLGDTVYGYRARQFPWLTDLRVMLHAWSLSFAHPVTGEKLTFKAELPQDFIENIRQLRERIVLP